MKKIRKIGILMSSIICSTLISCSTVKDNAGLVYGRDDATIKVVNYSSFQCPDCVILHEELHESIKKYIDNGVIQFIEKPVDVSRFEYDDFIYKHMNEEQINDFDKMSEIYKLRDQWMELESKEKIAEFLNLGTKENKDNIKDLKVITKEKKNINLEYVPTLYINGEKFTHDITAEEFESKIEELSNK